MTFAREVIQSIRNGNFTAGIEIPAGFGWGRAPETGNTVDLPHTWNREDFMSDRGYRRGYGSYRKELDIPKEHKGKRLSSNLKCRSVANVFINSNHLGEHKGAYNAFTYEITDYVKYGERILLM